MSLRQLVRNLRKAAEAGRPLKAPKSTCYDCGKRQHRAHTKVTYRTNTQGKAARVRVCTVNCLNPKETT